MSYLLGAICFVLALMYLNERWMKNTIAKCYSEENRRLLDENLSLKRISRNIQGPTA